MRLLSRRTFLVAAPLVTASLTLVGCFIGQSDRLLVSSQKIQRISPEIQDLYGPVISEPYSLPAADLATIHPKFLRQQVEYNTKHPPGTLVVDTKARFLYLIGENGTALRYGIGVGKEGLEFEGEGVIQYKRRWPNWTPTAAMMAREPERYGHLGQGMSPGLENPLGARALYLYKDGKDTLFRIHGTTEVWSIGQAISSGCIRLINQDIIDLYDRVPNGSRVIVLKDDEAAAETQSLTMNYQLSGADPQPLMDIREPSTIDKQHPEIRTDSLGVDTQPSMNSREPSTTDKPHPEVRTHSLGVDTQPSMNSREPSTTDKPHPEIRTDSLGVDTQPSMNSREPSTTDKPHPEIRTHALDVNKKSSTKNGSSGVTQDSVF